MGYRNVLTCLSLIAFATIAGAQERATKSTTAQPVQLEKSQATQPARVDKKPARAKTGKPFTQRVSTTPDINQHMKYEDLFEQIPKTRISDFDGRYDSKQDKVFTKNMCAPASVANHLVWFDTHFYPNITKEKDPVIAGVELAHTLGGQDYMKTVSTGNKDKSSGSTIHNVVKGAYRLLEERGVTVKHVKVISVSAHPSQANLYGVQDTPLTIEHRAPKVHEIKEALRRKAIVLNLFGKYTLAKETGANEGGAGQDVFLNRGGGHYFAPVGYGQNAKGNYDGNYIIYHNPADSPQTKKRQQYKRWYAGADKVRMIKKKAPTASFRACSFNKSWTCYGTLDGTYVRDKPLMEHRMGEEVRILEALIVIEV